MKFYPTNLTSHRKFDPTKKLDGFLHHSLIIPAGFARPSACVKVPWWWIRAAVRRFGWGDFFRWKPTYLWVEPSAPKTYGLWVCW